MTQPKIYLASDNWTPAHPLVLKSVVEANEGYAPSYGADLWTIEAQKSIQKAFKSNCKVFFLPTGTGANVLALKLSCHRHESIICTDIAHIHYQESGAAESIVGCKLLTAPHLGGKITPEAVVKKLKSERAFGKHSTSPRVLSIAQPTEVGTFYRLDELKSLSKLCKEENMFFHMDGSRLYNAVASMKCSLHELIEASQVDILSLGGTKNGLMGAEALLIFNSDLENGSDHQQKQTLQLLSKMRYISAQFIPFFKNDLWHTLASQANHKAQEIASLIKDTPHLSLSYPVQTNQVFFIAPTSWIPLMQKKIFCYPWDLEKNEVRFITSWNTSEDDIDNLKGVLAKISLMPA
ncbi:MAG: threonine aldolase [Parachlamydiaceae bacterium]|nr:threonine aldolase [Parachlamydiaceae bacterium]